MPTDWRDPRSGSTSAPSAIRAPGRSAGHPSHKLTLSFLALRSSMQALAVGSCSAPHCIPYRGVFLYCWSHLRRRSPLFRTSSVRRYNLNGAARLTHGCNHNQEVSFALSLHRRPNPFHPWYLLCFPSRRCPSDSWCPATSPVRRYRSQGQTESHLVLHSIAIRISFPFAVKSSKIFLERPKPLPISFSFEPAPRFLKDILCFAIRHLFHA